MERITCNFWVDGTSRMILFWNHLYFSSILYQNGNTNSVELINGTSSTTLNTQGSATRAQAAVILSRFLER